MAETKRKGMVYLVGAGPGDPGLITVRGAECLRRAEVVIYDHLVHPRLVDFVPENCERIYVGKKAGVHTLEQESINALLVEKCLEGKCVARLKGGDPFVFGRGGEEALALRDAGCAFEIVPGVTAGIAAAAYAGIPVTHRGLTSTMAFVTGHEKPGKDDSDIDWRSLAGIGTVVFYMGVGNLPMIAEQLTKNGRDPATPAAVIRWGTWPRQETVVGTLADIAAKAGAAGIKPPALIVVGEVVALRESLSWFEARPLFGQRIVVTRSRAQASDLSARLEELGAEVIEFPVIRIVPPEDPEPLRRSAARTGEYDWVVFTSVNGVDAFLKTLTEQGLDARALGKTKICAIGPTTAERLRERGLIADLLPPKYVAESVAETLSKQGNLTGARILLPRADIARSFLRETLDKMGAQVDEVIAYRTVLEEPENIEEVRTALLRRGISGQGILEGGILEGEVSERGISAVTFTSSSTVRNFAQLVGKETLRNISSNICHVSIGPETTKTLREFTSAPVIEAEEYTIEGVVNALVKNAGATTNCRRDASGTCRQDAGATKTAREIRPGFDGLPADAASVPLPSFGTENRSAGVPPARPAGVSPASLKTNFAVPPRTPMSHRKEGTIRDRGYLPHWETEKACYFVTFRLGDSIPKTLLETIQDERKRLQENAERQDREPTSSERERLARLSTKKIEAYLDTGAGACYFKNPEVADITANVLRHFDGKRYRLHAWCVMPNHVHVVFQPLHEWKLSEILHSWKSYSAKKANALLDRSGVFWDREYYDHLIRNEEEYGRILQYVLDNPAKAGLRDWPWLWVTMSELQQ